MAQVANNIAGLVFAIDFRYDGKDAWYRTVGSKTGTLGSAASITGGAFVGVKGDSDSYLTFELGAASQVPGTTGAVLCDFGIADNGGSTEEWVYNLSPGTGSGDAVDLFRTSADVLRHDLDGTGSVVGRRDISGYSGEISRRTDAQVWEDWDGVGTAKHYASVDGSSPIVGSHGTSARSESKSGGLLSFGVRNYHSPAASFGGILLYRFAIFNITNPAGENLKASGWDKDVIWNTLFDTDTEGTGNRTFHRLHAGTGVTGNSVTKITN